jgi:hypothetical protein
MTSRLKVFLSVLILVSISCSQAAQAPELPQSVSPGWQLVSVQEAGPHIWLASYSGPGTAHVRIWAIHGSAEGLERVQKWQAEANTVVVYSERYFAAVDWAGVDRAQAGSLVRAMEHAIGVQPEQAR